MLVNSVIVIVYCLPVSTDVRLNKYGVIIICEWITL